MILQYIVVFIIIAAAVGYTVWRCYSAWHAPGNVPPACAGCSLAATCKRKQSACKPQQDRARHLSTQHTARCCDNAQKLSKNIYDEKK